MTPTTRQALLGTKDDIAWRRTIPPEDRPPAMRVQVALAEALTREERLRELLADAVDIITDHAPGHTVWFGAVSQFANDNPRDSNG